MKKIVSALIALVLLSMVSFPACADLSKAGTGSIQIFYSLWYYLFSNNQESDFETRRSVYEPDCAIARVGDIEVIYNYHTLENRCAVLWFSSLNVTEEEANLNYLKAMSFFAAFELGNPHIQDLSSFYKSESFNQVWHVYEKLQEILSDDAAWDTITGGEFVTFYTNESGVIYQLGYVEDRGLVIRAY